MSNDSKQSETRQHEEAWELLPWYVNGTLEDPERKAVADHISMCATCEGELARCRAIASVVRSSKMTAWTPSPERVARMMARIDRQRPLTDAEHWRLRIRDWIEKSRLAFQQTPLSLRLALAAQSMVIVLLAAVIILNLAPSIAPPLAYRTLSRVEQNAVTGLDPDSVHISVVFADDITERELRALLSTVQGMIVAGPSPMGVYTVAVPASGGERAVRTRATLETLRAHTKVRLAELKEP